MYTQTARLTLRPLRMTDLEEVYGYRKDPEVVRYQSFEPFTREMTSDFMKEQAGLIFHKAGQWVQIGFALTETDKLVGDCAVKRFAHEPLIVEIGYTIAREHQRQGYAREGISGLLNFLFQQKQIHKVQALIDVRNIASIRFVEKLGFQKEGHFRENYFENGQWWDEVQYGLLRSAFRLGSSG
ncbi:MAG: GNAT family protein [Bacteroidota bacterium]